MAYCSQSCPMFEATYEIKHASCIIEHLGTGKVEIEDLD